MTPLTHVRTDDNGRFIRVEECTCEISQPDFNPPVDWEPSNDSCPLFDRHVALHQRITKGVKADV